ncbi:S-adenosyl-L-methionine-dependent methyltransferase [Ampelomyces quisqualis]|uniref:DNA (cytosine-5-)-methyltransferase n=1 Tax=Ampelomyces quisqualis TaxID=50730 RepID=A0A6A5QMC8_AMPQU|nr:S-adenosyl-L-methionine-dependent methyltransferase [Ampelomyces quisqualis]
MHLYDVDDDEYETAHSSDNELELLDLGTSHALSTYERALILYLGDDLPELEITGVSEKSAEKLRQNASITYPDSQTQRYKLSKGCVITPGATVELKDHSSHASAGDDLHSGDFLRVKHIIINLQTNEVRLRGHRLRRLKYFGQIFDWKFNELAMVLRVHENETRCSFVAGMEDIPVDQVLRLRDCVITNKPYPLLSFKDGPRCAFPASLSRKEVKQKLFHGGRLACRVVNIGFLSNNSKPYSGIVRHLYAREADNSALAGPLDGPGLSRKDAIPLDNVEHVVSPVRYNQQKKRRASLSFNESSTRKRISPMPKKQIRLTFGDCFCCAGGASQGAKQAGLHVVWGLDLDDQAMHVYSLNHPGALPFCQNAHDFPPKGYMAVELRVDILHLSPPCKYFSPAHTIPGKNDQANLEAIYTVGAIIKRVQPRVATLEQTFGLYTYEEHKANFNMLLRDIRTAGYDVRYRIVNMSEFGLAQPRKRLLMIAARRGTPLPPFPKPTHGPPGSGLKPFNYVKDALIPIERFARRPTNDPQHQPKPFDAPQRRKPYDPKTFLNGCITEKGSSTYHYSGTRKYTPRELALFQGFPVDYQFSGTKTQATAQVGNAYPPIVAEAVFASVAKTLEAFDAGYIDAEDDLSDLDSILERKGAVLQPRQDMVRRSLFDAAPQPSSQSSRYLIRDHPNSGHAIPTSSSPFARNKEPQQLSVEKTTGALREMSLLDRSLDGAKDISDNDCEVIESIEPRRQRQPARIIKNPSSEIIEISSGSEKEGDDD